MTKGELIDAFESGDMGSVEFFELALATDLTMAEIEVILENQEEFL